jgi:hypothetical protein
MTTLKVKRCDRDGEICCLDEDARSIFLRYCAGARMPALMLLIYSG